MFIYLHYTYDPKDEPYNPREKDAERTVCSLSHFPKAAAAATAKSLQSCLTLCDPIDGSPPGSPSLGFSRQEHWSGLPFLLQCMKVKVKVKVK